MHINPIALRKAKLYGVLALLSAIGLIETKYRIYSAIRRGFHLARMTTNNLISSM